MGIYIAKDDIQLGPYTQDEVISALAVGGFSLSNLAWSEGEAEWLALSDYAAKKGLMLTPAAPVIAPPSPPPMITALPPPPQPNMEIRIGKNGQQLGPFSKEGLISAYAAGDIALTDLAWSEGEAEWLMLSDYAAKKNIALKPAAPVVAPPSPPPKVTAPPPPPPPKAVSAPVPPPPPPVKDAWFVLRTGQEYGPYTKDDMRQYLKAGNFTVDDEVRNENEKDYKPLSSILPKPSVDLNAMAGKAAGIISDLGTKSAEMATKAMDNAGPLGAKLKDKTKGNEKMIFGGAGIGVLLLLIFVLLPGGPSSGDITQAVERQFSDAVGAAGGVLGASTKVSNLKKLGCKSADQGGYHCQFEYDIEVKMMGTSQINHQTGSARFVKDSKGWAAVGG